MKRMLVMLVLVGLTGCGKQASAPPPPAVSPGQMKLPPPPTLLPKVEAASQKYKAIASATPKPEVLRSLGAPQSTNAEGALVWEATEGKQTARLALKFNASGTMTGRSFDLLFGEQPK